MERPSEPSDIRTKCCSLELKGRSRHDEKREIIADTSSLFNNIPRVQGHLPISGVMRNISVELRQLLLATPCCSLDSHLPRGASLQATSISYLLSTLALGQSRVTSTRGSCTQFCQDFVNSKSF